MGYISCVSSYKTHISYIVCRQPIYSPYHGYNHSYLMITNFIGNSYMNDLVRVQCSAYTAQGTAALHHTAAINTFPAKGPTVGTFITVEGIKKSRLFSLFL